MNFNFFPHKHQDIMPGAIQKLKSKNKKIDKVAVQKFVPRKLLIVSINCVSGV